MSHDHAHAAHPHAASGHADDHAHHGPHVVPLWLLAAILGILLFFTVLTVAVRYVDMGGANIWIALGIAAAKGILVALYFMHLRWDSTFNLMSFVAALLFLALFIGFALMDSGEYLPILTAPVVGPNATP